MTDKRPQMQAGFVLHHRPYRDSSLTLDVFSQEQGRLALVARGARRPRSRQRALLQPFRPLLLSWKMGGAMGTLTEVEADDAALRLSGDYLLAGFYVNELVLRTTGRHDPNPELFEVYQLALRALEQGYLNDTTQGPAPALRWFEKRLLECLGYALPVDEICLDGSAIQPEGRYRFDVEAGAYPLADSSGKQGVSGRVLLALAREDFDDPDLLSEARRLLAAAIEPHLGGRPLQTARVLRDLRRRGLGRPASHGESGPSNNGGEA